MGRGESPTLTRREGLGGQIPHGLDREAREPGRDAEKDAPDGDEADEALADEPTSGAIAEDAEKLEEEGQFDGSQRHRIGDAANIEDL